jgi:hypothetical protein
MSLVDRDKLATALIRFQRTHPDAPKEQATALEVAIDLITPESEFESDDVDLRAAGLQWALLVGLEGEAMATRVFRGSKAARLKYVQERLNWLFELPAAQTGASSFLEAAAVQVRTYYLILWSRPPADDHSRWEVVYVPQDVLAWRDQYCDAGHCYTNYTNMVVERGSYTAGGTSRAVMFADNNRPRARLQGTIIAAVRFATDTTPARETLIDYAASIVARAVHLPAFDPAGVATGGHMAVGEGT